MRRLITAVVAACLVLAACGGDQPNTVVGEQDDGVGGDVELGAEEAPQIDDVDDAVTDPDDADEPDPADNQADDPANDDSGGADNDDDTSNVEATGDEPNEDGATDEPAGPTLPDDAPTGSEPAAPGAPGEDENGEGQPGDGAPTGDRPATPVPPDDEPAEDDILDENDPAADGRVGAGLPSGTVLELATGDPVDLTATLADADEVILLWFWSPGDDASAAESEVVARLATEQADLTVMAVGIGGDASSATAFARDNDLPGVTVVWDETADIAEQYSVTAPPSAILLDDGGDVIGRWTTLSPEVFQLIDLLT
ncbi:MAG: hypothetical protein AAF467_27555 [Actinomycetota bacterium]